MTDIAAALSSAWTAVWPMVSMETISEMTVTMLDRALVAGDAGRVAGDGAADACGDVLPGFSGLGTALRGSAVCTGW